MTKNQQTGLSRNTIDKYYTKESIVKKCIIKLKKYITITNDDLIIESSAGNGSFINQIKKLCHNYIFYDLEPENSEIIKQDYLKFNYDSIPNNNLYKKNSYYR